MVDEDHLKRGFGQAPIVRSLGLQLLEARRGKARVELPFREDLQQGLGLLHGGVMTLVADTASWFAVASIRDDSYVASVELNINFLKPAIRTAVIAAAEVVKSGRRVAVARFEVRSATGDLLAVGHSTLVTSELEHVGIPRDVFDDEGRGT